MRSADLDHPDELRIDLDPQPGVAFNVVRQVALAAREVLDEHGLAGFPKTSGSRGIHVVVPITPTHGFTEVRRAALALARELERRLPDAATSAWWKEERGERVLVDYNQNARDRTVASAYSVLARTRVRSVAICSRAAMRTRIATHTRSGASVRGVRRSAVASPRTARAIRTASSSSLFPLPRRSQLASSPLRLPCRPLQPAARSRSRRRTRCPR